MSNILCIVENTQNILDRLYIEDDMISVFSRDGIVRFRSENNLDKAAELIHGIEHTRISNLFEIDKKIFWKILNEPLLHFILRKIYSTGYHCTTFSSNNLRKNIDEHGWHCDYPYHDMELPYPKETLGIQVLWTLDDFTIENGCTYFVRGSHKFCSWPDDNIDKFDRVIAKKGEVVIMAGKLWHTQGINTTDNDRAALLANFSPLDITAKDPMNEYSPPEYLSEGKVIFRQ